MSIAKRNRIGKTILDYSIQLATEEVLLFLLEEIVRLKIDYINYDWALLQTALASQLSF